MKGHQMKDLEHRKKKRESEEPQMRVRRARKEERRKREKRRAKSEKKIPVVELSKRPLDFKPTEGKLGAKGGVIEGETNMERLYL